MVIERVYQFIAKEAVFKAADGKFHFKKEATMLTLFHKISLIVKQNSNIISSKKLLTCVAYCLTFGIGGFAQNHERALKLFNMAIDKKDETALLALAWIYMAGAGCMVKD